MSVELFQSNGQIRDVLTFSPEEIAELSDDRKTRLNAVIKAKAELDAVDAEMAEAAELTKDAEYALSEFKRLFQNRWRRTFMQEWAAAKTKG